MRALGRVLFAVSFFLLAAAPARAQTSVTRTATPPATANLALNLTMSLQGAVVLSLAGNAVAPSTSLTNIVAGTGADIAFGNVDTACSNTPTTGQCIRMTNASGAFFVATVDATVTVSGVAAGTSKLGISAPAATGAAAQRYRVCGANGSCPATTPDPFWQVSAGGTTIPLTPTVGANELGATIASGAVVEHQLGVQVLDTVTAVNPVVVSYVATAN
ncbi:MAG: hypothetical protein AAB426_08220 [Myxococcota bacterium]